MPQLPGKYYLSVAAITANAGRYPISAKCEILGVPRSTYCSMRGHKEKPKQPDPLTPEVILAHEANRRAYGARKMKAALERRGFCASRRRIGRIMRENGLVGAYPTTKFKAHAGRPDEAQPPTWSPASSTGAHRGRASSRISPTCGSAPSGTASAFLSTSATGRPSGTPRASAKTQGP